MYIKPKWSGEGKGWPHRETSRFLQAGGVNWHVQIMGSGPVLVLLHGTGAATHSWAKLMPLLAPHYTIVAMDLPGHGFSSTPEGSKLSLPGMAGCIGLLLTALKVEPFAIIGHSAGAAIAAQMILTGKAKSNHLISINGAFKPFDGLAAHIFPVVAKLVALNPVTIFALSQGGKDRERVAKMLASTGSNLDETTIELYARLFGTSGHVGGVMGMMARWELDKLASSLPKLALPVTLIVGTNDKTIPPNVSKDVQRLVKAALLFELEGLGHLAHEEDGAAVARVILKVLTRPLAGALEGKAV